MKHILTLAVALTFAVPVFAHEGCSDKAKSKDSTSETCKDKAKSSESHTCAEACKDKCTQKSEGAK